MRSMTSKDGSKIAYDRYGEAPAVSSSPVRSAIAMPMWKGLKATAHTLPCDCAALGKHTMYGAPLNADEWASVTRGRQPLPDRSSGCSPSIIPQVKRLGLVLRTEVVRNG
jgi:hypothetical protein